MVEMTFMYGNVYVVRFSVLVARSFGFETAVKADRNRFPLVEIMREMGGYGEIFSFYVLCMEILIS